LCKWNLVDMYSLRTVIAKGVTGSIALALAKGRTVLVRSASLGVIARRKTTGHWGLRRGLVVRPARRGPRVRMGIMVMSWTSTLGNMFLALALVIKFSVRLVVAVS
jgi:hypothetical protein